ncbi:MAG: sulfatase-like hydrolase/transferase [Proteobacteria bacterium]|nr:sulfatase-like hydrolase/transferase [Pseudomonadota bacterium]
MFKPAPRPPRPSSVVEAALALLAATGLGLAVPVWVLQRIYYFSHLPPFANDWWNALLTPVFFLLIPWALGLGLYLVLRRVASGAARVWLWAASAVGLALFAVFWLARVTGGGVWVAAAALVLAGGLFVVFRRSEGLWRRIWVVAGVGVALAGAALTLWSHWNLAHKRALYRGRDVPVFVVVFDEFSSFLLRDPQGRIDARLFPNFAWLAGRATWYANMTVGRRNCPITAHSMLSGRRLYRLPPGYDQALRDMTRLPPNVMALLAPTRRLIVFEAWKRLIRTSPELKHPWYFSAPWSRGLSIYLKRWAVTYAHFLFKAGRSGGGWYGGAARAATPDKRPPPPHRPSPVGACQLRTDRVLDYDRMRRFELKRVRRFLAALGPGRRQIGWLYSRLSHFPYWLGPDGEHIVIHPLHQVRVNGRVIRVPHPWAGERKFYFASRLDRGETSFNLRRSYLNQLRLVDRVLGRILGRLRRLGLFDRALIIVYSDHGMGFTGDAPGGAIRTAWSPARQLASAMMNAATLLVVKYPGQKQGRIDRRLARPSDLGPTLIQVLGLKRPWPMDGTSLLSPNPPRRRIEFIAPFRRPGLSRTDFGRLGLVAPLGFRPWTPNLQRPGSRWLGRPVGDLPVVARIRGCLGSVAMERTVRPDARTESVLTLFGVTASSPRLTLIALNGRLVKAVRASQWVPELGRSAGWIVVLPPGRLRVGRNEVRAFVSRGPSQDKFAEVQNRFVFSLEPDQVQRLRSRAGSTGPDGG